MHKPITMNTNIRKTVAPRLTPIMQPSGHAGGCVTGSGWDGPEAIKTINTQQTNTST